MKDGLRGCYKCIHNTKRIYWVTSLHGLYGNFTRSDKLVKENLLKFENLGMFSYL